MHWQIYEGGAVRDRWNAANAWMKRARQHDPEFTVRGYYTQPGQGGTGGSLVIEFESDQVLPEHAYV